MISPGHFFNPHLARPGDCYDCGASEAEHPPMVLPYDPKPRALVPATNGWIWCEACECPRELPHACEAPR